MARKLVELKPTNIMMERIYIKTNRIGYIPPLRMQGPIVAPIPVTREIAKAMVVAGIETYMIDPVTKEPTLLTLKNVYPGEGDQSEEPVQQKQNTFKSNRNYKGPKQAQPKVSSGMTDQTPIKPVDLVGVPNNSTDKKEEVKDTDNSSEIKSEDTNVTKEVTKEKKEDSSSNNTDNNYYKNKKKNK